MAAGRWPVAASTVPDVVSVVVGAPVIVTSVSSSVSTVIEYCPGPISGQLGLPWTRPAPFGPIR